MKRLVESGNSVLIEVEDKVVAVVVPVVVVVGFVIDEEDDEVTELSLFIVDFIVSLIKPGIKSAGFTVVVTLLVVVVVVVVEDGVRLKLDEVKLFVEFEFANKFKRDGSLELRYIYGLVIAAASVFDAVAAVGGVVLVNLLSKRVVLFDRIELFVSNVDGIEEEAVGFIICERAKSCSKLFVAGLFIALKFKVVVEGNTLLAAAATAAALFNFNEFAKAGFKLSPVPVVKAALAAFVIVALGLLLVVAPSSKLLISLPCKANKELNSLGLLMFKLLRSD